MATLQVIVGGETTASLELPSGNRPQLRFLWRDPADGALALLAKRPQTLLAAFQRDRRQWLVLSPPDASLTVNRRPVIGLKVLDHEDEVEVDDIRLRLVAMSREHLAGGASLIARNKACPVCLDHFAEGDEVAYCPNCELAHHEACLRGHGRCASYPFDGYTVPGHEPTAEGAAE